MASLGGEGGDGCGLEAGVTAEWHTTPPPPIFLPASLRKPADTDGFGREAGNSG